MVVVTDMAKLDSEETRPEVEQSAPGVSIPDIHTLKADALERQAKLHAELKRVQELVPQIIGALNQVAGELKALEAMGAK